jgi:hypothetical protein
MDNINELRPQDSSNSPEKQSQIFSDSPPGCGAYDESGEGSDNPEPMSLETALIILARDGLDQPINDMEIKIDFPDGNSIQAKTNAQGVVTTPSPTSREGIAHVSVLGKDGKTQPVCTIDLARCQGAAIIRSPKVAVPFSLDAHQPKTVTVVNGSNGNAWYDLNGAVEHAWKWVKDLVHVSDNTPPLSGAGNTPHVVKRTANSAGNPLIVAVGAECPNSDNLRLGRNNVYRGAIINAAKRVGIMPQAMAALIDAEAAKKTETFPVPGADGKPSVNKKTGKPKVQTVKEHWDKDSYNTRSRAAGLTQFLESTWLAHCLKSGCYIHEQSVAKGWVKTESGPKGQSKIIFILADGKTTPQPWKHIGDASVQACLKERFTPEWSIMAAADYGKANLEVLQKAGFKLSGLNDAEKAKLMYLLHHEGEGAGPLFIRDELSKLPKGKFASAEERLKHVFGLQVGEKKAVEALNKAHGDAQEAYRYWLSDYINVKIKIDRFCCDSSKASHATDVFDIFKKIGGKGK